MALKSLTKDLTQKKNHRKAIQNTAAKKILEKTPGNIQRTHVLGLSRIILKNLALLRNHDHVQLLVIPQSPATLVAPANQAAPKIHVFLHELTMRAKAQAKSLAKTREMVRVDVARVQAKDLSKALVAALATLAQVPTNQFFARSGVGGEKFEQVSSLEKQHRWNSAEEDSSYYYSAAVSSSKVLLGQ